jgi:hypothetical protein
VKKIIPKALLLIGLALPVLVSAQMPESRYIGEGSRAVFVKWVEQAIASGKVVFQTTFYRDRFLEGCRMLYAANKEVKWQEHRDWLICENIAGMLVKLCDFIPDKGQREWAAKNCEAAHWGYAHPGIMVSTLEQIERRMNPPDANQPAE